MGLNDNLKQKYDNLKSGKLTCEQNVKDFLSNINKNDEKYNIFLELNKNLEEDAKKLDKKRENKEKLGKLFGFCFAIKSNISVIDMNISCSSKTLQNYKGTYNAEVIKRILAEDALIIGIVGNDEFACGSSGETSAFGNVINPFSPQRIPGGSSSGSAAAIAANFCDIALGSDTGGSIRNPASHCGVIGIKPSYGRVSRYGLIDLSMSLDQIGPLSKNIFGSALTMNVISGFSDTDSTTQNFPVQDYTNQEPNKKYKIGIIKDFENFIQDTRIQEILNKRVEQLKALGHEIVNIKIKNIDLAIQAYYPIVYTEFFSGTRKFDGVKYAQRIEDTCGDEVLRRILGGKEISKSEFDGAYYKKALKVKEVIDDEFERAFEDVDFILAPTTPMIPHKFGTKLTAEQMYSYDAFTIPANLGGICGAVISKDTVQEDDGKVSVGLQIFANKFAEDKLFQGLNLIDSLK